MFFQSTMSEMLYCCLHVGKKVEEIPICFFSGMFVLLQLAREQADIFILPQAWFMGVKILGLPLPRFNMQKLSYIKSSGKTFYLLPKRDLLILSTAVNLFTVPKTDILPGLSVSGSTISTVSVDIIFLENLDLWKNKNSSKDLRFFFIIDSLNIYGLWREKTCLWSLKTKWDYRDYRNFARSKSRYNTLQQTINKGADQTVWMCRLVCSFIFCKPPKTGFLIYVVCSLICLRFWQHILWAIWSHGCRHNEPWSDWSGLIVSATMNKVLCCVFDYAADVIVRYFRSI